MKNNPTPAPWNWGCWSVKDNFEFIEKDHGYDELRSLTTGKTIIQPSGGFGGNSQGIDIENPIDKRLIEESPIVLQVCKDFMDAWIQKRERSLHQLKTDMDLVYNKALTVIRIIEGEDHD